MLLILALIFVGNIFSKLAKSKERNATLWVIIGIVTFFVSQLLLGVAIGIFRPAMLEDETAVNILGLCASTVGVIIVYVILYQLPDGDDGYRNKFRNDDILDDENMLQ